MPRLEGWAPRIRLVHSTTEQCNIHVCTNRYSELDAALSLATPPQECWTALKLFSRDRAMRLCANGFTWQTSKTPRRPGLASPPVVIGLEFEGACVSVSIAPNWEQIVRSLPMPSSRSAPNACGQRRAGDTGYSAEGVWRPRWVLAVVLKVMCAMSRCRRGIVRELWGDVGLPTQRSYFTENTSQLGNQREQWKLEYQKQKEHN